MTCGIIVYESYGHYMPFTMADDTLYNPMKETLSSKSGSERYGMKFLNGKKGIFLTISNLRVEGSERSEEV